MHKRQIGATLIEVLFVLAIGAGILVMGFRQYQAYEMQQEVDQIKQNVDTIFIALAHYYQAKCKTSSVDDSTTLTLADLQAAGFLGAWQPPANMLVDTNYGEQGYGVRFNLNQDNAYQNAYACWNFDVKDSNHNQGQQCGDIKRLENSSVIIMRAQVTVKLDAKYQRKMSGYQSMLGADCSSFSPYSCSPNPTGTPYLIWQRLPSFASPTTRSSFWPTLPLLKQFNMQYTNDGMALLSNINVTDTNSNTNTAMYLCGG